MSPALSGVPRTNINLVVSKDRMVPLGRDWHSALIPSDHADPGNVRVLISVGVTGRNHTPDHLNRIGSLGDRPTTAIESNTSAESALNPNSALIVTVEPFKYSVDSNSREDTDSENPT